MRKPLILLTAIILLLCLSGVSFAQEGRQKIGNREEAINHAAQLFPEIIKGMENQLEVDFRNDQYYGREIWDINYTRHEPGPYRLRISFDSATGQLIDFNHLPDKYSASSKVINRDEAKKIAEAFIKKHHPDKLDKMTEQERQPVVNFSSSQIELAYSFGWHQLIDGIPFDGNTISVGVNALSGEVTSFYCRWRDSVQIPKDKAINLDEFINQTVNTLGVYPCYVITPGAANLDAKLVYRLNTGYIQFDAAGGNPLSYQGKEDSIEEARTFNRQFNPVPAPATRLNPQLEQEPISPNKLQQIAESFFKQFGIEGDVKRTGSGRSSGAGYSMEYWSYSVEQDSNSYGYNEISIGINTRTGEIVNYRNSQAESRNTEGEGVTRDKALETATEFLTAINPANTKNMILMNESAYLTNEPLFRFSWARLVNGIPVMDDSAQVTVDRYSGKVISLFNRERPAKLFPGTQEMITPEQALEAYKKAQPFELKYSVPYYLNEPTEKARLVYVTDYDLAVDALTGEITRLYVDTRDPDSYYAKINHHWARLPLILLADSGLLPEPEAFDPNGSVTRREGLRVLGAIPTDYYYGVSTGSPFTDVNNDDDDLEIVLRAVQFNIIEPGGQLHPDAHLTREDLAVWLVNMLGHGKVAEAPLNIGLDYRDAGQISDNKKNSVAIATALKLIGGDTEGNFNPQSPVTWGELASVVIRVAPQMVN